MVMGWKLLGTSKGIDEGVSPENKRIVEDEETVCRSFKPLVRRYRYLKEFQRWKYEWRVDDKFRGEDPVLEQLKK